MLLNVKKFNISLSNLLILFFFFVYLPTVTNQLSNLNWHIASDPVTIVHNTTINKNLYAVPYTARNEVNFTITAHKANAETR